MVDAVRGTVLARGPLPNNPSLTLIGGVAWRADGRLAVQSFAPNPGAASGVVMEATVRDGGLAFAAWPFDGSAALHGGVPQRCVVLQLRRRPAGTSSVTVRSYSRQIPLARRSQPRNLVETGRP